MKKNIFGVLVSILFCTSIHAQTFTFENINYKITDANKKYVEVGSNISFIGAADIPNMVNNNNNNIVYTVTAISNRAFESSDLTSVTIPDSVTSIGDYAFVGLDLTSVTIPDSVTSIGEGAFYNCANLTNVTIIGSIDGNSATSIGAFAFDTCTSLKSVTIPDSVTIIGFRAFHNCTDLKSVTIPNSVISIGDFAFYKCVSLTSVTIGSSVTSIGDFAFAFCSKLISVISLKPTPPTLAGTTFESTTYDVGTLVVPDGSKDAYDGDKFWSGFTTTETAVIWDGSDSSDWATDENWHTGNVPNATKNVVIPDLDTAPIIGTKTVAEIKDLTITETDGLTIASGGSLIVSGTSSGNVTYKRTLTYDDDDDAKSWHLVSSPLSGETMTGMRANNSFVTNESREISFAPYDNSQSAVNDRWSYFENTATDALVNGKGYSTKISAAGDISFTGTINTSDISIALTQGSKNGGNNFNLLGNPFTTFMNSGAFLTENTNELEQKEIYVWNGALGAKGAYETKVAGVSFKVAPGQGFFVEANSTNDVTFTEAMQSHEATDTFQRSSKTEVQLFINDGNDSKFLKVYYINGTTKGFDNGYDGKLFGGVSHPFALYSHLVSESQGENYQIQSLPNSEYENMVIPIGVNAAAGKEVTFSAEALNVPADIKVFLEDRLTNTYTRLDETNSEYKVTLSETLNGVGRFYMHTTQSVLSTDAVILNSVQIYKTGVSTLKITGLPQGKTSFYLYNILGKEMMKTLFTSNGNKEISLSKLASGIYVAKMQTEKGAISKKIILE